MVTRQHVLGLVESGLDYESAARELGISAGLAYLVATGLPADGSDARRDSDRDRPGFVATSTQHFATSAPVHNPTHHAVVSDWVQRRVQADAAMQHAAAHHGQNPGPRDPDDDRDIMTVLGRDHNKVHTLTKQFKTTPGVSKGGAPDQIAHRAFLVGAIHTALAEHEAAEQQHLWPAVVALVPDGARLAADGQRQEHDADHTLAQLAACDPQTERFDELIEQLQHQIRVHVALEDRVFLAFAAVTTSDERAQLGARIRATEKVEHVEHVEQERIGDGPA